MASADPVLFGDQTVESGHDNNTSGLAEAFAFANSTNGTTASISAYVDSSNAATKVFAGVYADSNGHPGSLLASGSLATVKAGAWNNVTVPSVAVSAGRTYWIAVLGTGGTLQIRDRSSGTCVSETSYSTALTALPSAWKSGARYKSCPISAYVNGYVAASTTPPANTGLPTVTGTATDGQTLTTSTGTWSGTLTGYAYQWRQCDSSGASCTSIAGATSSSYKLTSNDVGHTLRAAVTATNSGGSTTATSAQSALIAPVTPSSSSLPVINGTAVQGQTVSTSNGSWSRNPTRYVYAWQDCDSSGNSCASISGANTSSYAITDADVGHTLRSVVTATNAGGSGSATSLQTGLVTAPAAPTASFTFSPADPLTGQSIHFDASGSKCPATPCTFAWADLPPGGGSWPLGSGPTIDFTFSVTATKYVTLTVTDAQNRVATVEHDVTVGTATVSPPTNTSLPTISGTPQAGNTLTESDGTWAGIPASYSYQWHSCDSSGANCSNATGETGKTYVLDSGDVGHTIRDATTATNSGGATSATTAATPVVTAVTVAAPTNTALPAITGTPQQGGALTATTGTWTGSPSYAYQWRQCDSSGATCVNATGAGATSPTYTVASGDVSHTLRVNVIGSNAGGSAVATSAATTTVTASSGGTPPSARYAPVTWGVPQVGEKVHVSTGVWTTGRAITSYTYQWQDCDASGNNCTDAAGSGSSCTNSGTGCDYTLQSSDHDHTMRASVVANNGSPSAAAVSYQSILVQAAESSTCDYNAANATDLTNAVAAAKSGQKICLATGDYGNWAGTRSTSKEITIAPQPNAHVTMQFSFYTGDGNFTIDGGHTNLDSTSPGITMAAGNQFGGSPGPQGIVLKNVAFTAAPSGNIATNFVNACCSSSQIVWDHDIFYGNGFSDSTNGEAQVRFTGGAGKGSVIEYSLFRDQSNDGIKIGAPNITIVGNTFQNMQLCGSCDAANHTDGIQMYGGDHDTILGNFYKGSVDMCMDAFDGTAGNVIEDNVVYGCASHAIVMSGDGTPYYPGPGSWVQHNTVVGGTGTIECTSKPGEGPSTTYLSDNVASDEKLSASGSDPCTPSLNTHNLLSSSSSASRSPNFAGTPIFVGGSNPTSYAGFALASSSPGKGAATDAEDVGARVVLYPRP